MTLSVSRHPKRQTAWWPEKEEVTLSVGLPGDKKQRVKPLCVCQPGGQSEGRDDPLRVGSAEKADSQVARERSGMFETSTTPFCPVNITDNSVFIHCF